MPLQKVGNIYGTGGGGMKKVGNIKDGSFKLGSQQKIAPPEGVSNDTFRRAQNIPKKTGFSGFAENLKNDFSSFAKGMIGVGREVLTNPVDTTKKLGGMGKEVIKALPQAGVSFGKNLANFTNPEYHKQAFQAMKKLRSMSYEEQKQALQNDIQRIQNTSGDENKKRLAKYGLAFLGGLTQYSHPLDKAYNEPFSTTLDVIPLAKGAGLGNGVSYTAGKVNQIPVINRATSKVSEMAQDAFVPQGKLRRIGYGNVADDYQKTLQNMRDSQAGIITSTVDRFKNFSNDERTAFFESIDSLRRTPDVYPTNANPKIQGMIDWYMKEELPRIKRTTGVIKQRADIAENVSKQLAKKQWQQLQNKLKKMDSRDTSKKTFSSGVYLSAKPTKYNVEDILKSAIEELRTNKAPIVVPSRIEIRKTLPRKYNIGDVIESARKELIDYKTNRKAPLKPTSFDRQNIRYIPSKAIYSKQKIAPLTPTSLEKTYGRTIPVNPRISRKFVNKQLGVINDLPVRKVKGQGDLEKILKEYRDNPEGITNYLHHFFNPTNETRFGGKLSSPSRGFLKQSKDVEGYVKDPVVAIAGVKSKAATANIKDAFVARVAKQYAKPADTVTEFKNGTIVETATGMPLTKWKGQYLPKELGDELTRFEGGKGMVDKMLTPLRVFNRNWKPLATAVRPRYHLRNIIGNMYNASFVGGANLTAYFKAAGQQLLNHIGTQMKEGTIAGKVYKAMFKNPPSRAMYNQAIDDGIIGRGFFSGDINDIADIAQSSGDFAKAIDKMKNPAEIYKVPVLRRWIEATSRVGQAFEDNARLALYMDRINKGSTRMKAKAYVNEHLFDYINGLGEADKVIKTIIPFWSWTRFNTPLQYASMWRNPIRNVVAQEFGKPIVQESEQSNPEYQYLSQREKDMGAFKVGEETMPDGTVKDKYVRTQGVLPVQDIMKVTDPENLGVSPIFNMGQQALNYISPTDKPQTNLDYFGQPVESFPGEVKRFLGAPMRGTTKEFLGNIPAISEINKGVGGSYTDDKRPSLDTRLEGLYSPLANFTQDRETARKYFYSDLDRQAGGSFAPGYESEFKYAVKSLIERPDDSVANENLKILTTLMRQNGFSDYDIQKSISEALKSFGKSDKAKTMEREEIMRNIEGIKTKPFFIP